jgi:hypothetical protein
MDQENERILRIRQALEQYSARLVLPAWNRVDYRSAGAFAVIVEHLVSIEHGFGGYLDPETSLFVFDAMTLWNQGRCCGRGCRHCPFAPRRGDEWMLLCVGIEGD